MALLVGVLALFAGGCSSGGEGAAETTSSTTEEPDGPTTTSDPTAGLSIERESEPLPATETQIGDQVVSELAGAAGDSGATSESQVSASEATEAERNLTELGAVRTPDGLVVTLPETVLFDFDEAVVRPDAAATLDQVAQVLVFYDQADIEIHGHTDSRGDDAYNQELSERRAQAVADNLGGRPGIDPGRLEARGFGEARPVAANETADGGDDPDGRQRNRRVEILLKEV
ncbi:OmpA family protein [soil metagenome]